MGGEYLFSFDQGECQTEVLEQGLVLGTDPAGPFFSCMQSRGYALLSADSGSEQSTGGRELVANGE